MSDHDSNKLCVICGDLAIGKNFNAYTCQPCKAFFRRNATMKRSLKCFRKNNCDISLGTRKFCKKCRLVKCYAMGMKIDVIYKIDKKIGSKTAIQAHNESNSSDHSTSSETRDSTATSSSSLSDESVSYTSHTNTTSPHIHYTDITSHTKHTIHYTNDYSKQIPYLDIIDFSRLMTDIHIPDGQPVSVIPINRPLMDYRNQFNELEGNRLQELLSAAQVFTERPTIHTSDEIYYLDIYGPIIERFDIQLRKIIKMCKMLCEFKSLCEPDKTSLIKYGFIELYMIRSIIHYNMRHDYWKVVMPNNSTAILRLESMQYFPRNIYYLYRIFFHKILLEWESDSVILDLLTAIILFNPNRPNLIHRDAIKVQQQVYMRLLQRYLLLKYQSENESHLKCIRLLKSLFHLHGLAVNKYQNCLESDPQVVPYPLLREVFDMPSMKDKDIRDNLNTLIYYDIN